MKSTISKNSIKIIYDIFYGDNISFERFKEDNPDLPQSLFDNYVNNSDGTQNAYFIEGLLNHILGINNTEVIMDTQCFKWKAICNDVKFINKNINIIPMEQFNLYIIINAPNLINIEKEVVGKNITINCDHLEIDKKNDHNFRLYKKNKINWVEVNSLTSSI